MPRIEWDAQDRNHISEYLQKLADHGLLEKGWSPDRFPLSEGMRFECREGQEVVLMQGRDSLRMRIGRW